MATMLMGVSVPNAAANTWRSGFRLVLPLPCPNFRESARALTCDDLTAALRVITAIWEFDALHRSCNWPPEPLSRGAAAGYARENIDAYSMNVSLICWWSLWHDFPEALALYEYEVLMALQEQSNKAGRYRRIVADELDRCRHRLGEAAIATPPSPKAFRRFTKDIEWLGDARFHACHRNYLVHSNRAWYGQYGWRDPSIKLRVDQTVKRTTLFDHLGAAVNPADHHLPVFAYEFWFPDSVVEFAECVRYEHPDMPGAPRRTVVSRPLVAR